MPFGLIFGALYFLLLAILFAMPVSLLVPPSRVTEWLLAVMSLGLVAGLLGRRPWARWSAMVVAAVMALSRLQATIQFGSFDDWLILFGAALTAILLAIPITGATRRPAAPVADPIPASAPGTADVPGTHPGLDTPESPPAPRRSRFGVIVGTVTVVSLIGAVVTFVPAVLSSSRQAGPRPDLAAMGIHSVPWREFGPGMELAASEGKPVLVDFYAEWCGPCKTMDRHTLRDPEVVRLLQEVVAVRIDAEGREEIHGFVGEDLADRYGVVSYPTIVLMDASGREIARSRGAKRPAEFARWLERSLEEARARAGGGDDTYVM